MGHDLREYEVLAGKPEGKRLLRNYRSRWDDDIKVVLKEIVWEVVDWIHLGKYKGQWRALVKKVTKFLFP
jgi:hypothetical protein